MYTQRGSAVLAILLLPAVLWAQETPPAEPTPEAGRKVSQFRSIASLAAEGAEIHTTVDRSEQSETPAGEGCRGEAHHLLCSEVWGILELPLYATGSRMAPNGVPYNPLFGLNFDFNVGLLPHKELYLFADNKFITQRAGPDITNARQGKLDFSKREYDLDFGVAWNYCYNFEVRVLAYALNNLNRGNSLSSPFGFKDGIGLENRYYFSGTDMYDVGRLSFVSLGYYPSKSLVGGDGTEFHPGLFARAYLTYDVPALRSYAYFDGQFIGERAVKARLLEMDVGLAARPFGRLENLEFRLGYDVTGDVQANTTRNLVYGAIRLAY